jgi:tRNA(Ile)-lysidine synthase
MNPTHPLLPLDQKLAQAGPAGTWGEVRILVAVSGGADSVTLARSLHRLVTPQSQQSQSVTLAHFNHGLRGERSTADEHFVCTLAQQLELPCIVGRDETLASAPNPDGIEAAARDTRYRFLLATAEKVGARYVLTGHTADDQAETVLHHLLRGSGLAGLAGIPRARVLSPAVTLLRPMLALRRSEVLEYLSALNQPYCTDATNADVSLTRNCIRHELLPLLARDYAPGVVDSLLRTSALAGDAQRIIETLAESLLDEALTESGSNRVTLDCRRLRAAERHLVREALVILWRRHDWPRQAMGWDQWNLLADLVLAAPNQAATTIMLPGAVSAQKTGEQLVLARS